MNVIALDAADLALAAILVLALAGLSYPLRLGIGNRILVAAARTCIQLLLVGLVLKFVFELATLWSIAPVVAFMWLAAAREAAARQERRLRGWWGFGIGAISMFLSSFTVTFLALVVLIGPTPWYAPQYSIPLLGMLLGNTMTGVSLAMDRLTTSAWRERPELEQRLMLGEPWWEVIADIRRESARAGMIPIINAMVAAGIVSLPGMMTGQILAGTPPTEAVKYQVLIMFLIAAGTGFGTIASTWIGVRRLFDDRHRLRLERLMS